VKQCNGISKLTAIVSGKTWAVLAGAIAMLALLPIPIRAQDTETVLYNFCQVGEHCSDGHNPGFGTLTFDAQGNLYGTTLYGGTQNGNGVVYNGSSADRRLVHKGYCRQFLRLTQPR
jgi:hypothetical protein